MFFNFYQNKRVFLTGHTGFKGSWLAEWLLSLGAEVHGFALDPQPHELLYGQLGLAGRIHSDTRADLLDRVALTRTLLDCQPHIVFHLAAQPLVRLSYDIPVETFAINVMGTAHLLDAVRTYAKPCSVVCITTDKCYDNREWLHAYREEDAMGGHDPYSASKGAAELVIASYRRSFFPSAGPIRVASARAGNVIGGGDWAIDRIVPDCIRAIRAGTPIPVRNKTATRPWQHVLEPLSGYLTLGAALASSSPYSCSSSVDLRPSTAKPSDSSSPLSHASCVSRFTSELSSAFNFGPALTSNRTVAELTAELIKHTGGSWIDQSDPHALHEASKLNLATDKAFHMLGWQPTWDFPTTIAKTAGWYLAESQDESAASLTQGQIQTYCHDAAAKGHPWASLG